MKHGIAFRKLSRSPSHRMLMLRNLVTSLFEHEQIKTTLPKAKEAARLAEKIITLGKRGSLVHAQRAAAFLLKPKLVPKLFNILAPRYAARPGGYTRIHKFGNRHGDNAPNAILELVDNPRDLKFELTARAVGWELFGSRLRKGGTAGLDLQVPASVARVVEEAVARERQNSQGGLGVRFRQYTQWNLKKALKYRADEGLIELGSKARDYMDRLAVLPEPHFTLQRGVSEPEGSQPDEKRLHEAGERLPQMHPASSSLGIAKADLRRERPWERKKFGIVPPDS